MIKKNGAGDGSKGQVLMYLGDIRDDIVIYTK